MILLMSFVSQGMGGQLEYFGIWIDAEYGTLLLNL